MFVVHKIILYSNVVVTPQRVLHIEKEKRSPLTNHQIAHERGITLSAQAYEDSTTDPSLDLDPYLMIDYVDDEWRRNVRFGDLWLPYTRVAAYLQRELTPVQYETSREPQEVSASFDLRILRDEDLVRIGSRFYNGFDVKKLLISDLEDGVEELLSDEAIRPHECASLIETPTTAAVDKPEAQEKKPFWARDDSMWALMASFLAFFTAMVIGSLVLHDYMEDKYLWYANFQTTITIEIGMGCLAWVITDRLAAKRTYYLGEQTQTRWKLATAYSIVATLNVALVMYITAKS